MSAPSELFIEWSGALGEAARLGPIVDLACGRGRHTLAAAELALPVVGVDRSRESLLELRAGAAGRPIDLVEADLEAPGHLPFRRARFGAVLVFRYLHRPRVDAIARLLAPGGLLIYETYLEQQREFGFGPKRPEFLLAPGELPTLFPDLELLESNEGLRDGPRPEWTARLVAMRRR